MKKPKLLIILFALCCALLLGAGPNLLPTTDFYVNDAAGILSGGHKARMLAIAEDLEEKAGVQLVVLTMSASDDPDDFAANIFREWEIGGLIEENGILILAVKTPATCVIHVGGGLSASLTQAQADSLESDILSVMKKGNASKAVINGHVALAQHLYQLSGIIPDEQISALFELEEGGFNFSPMIGVAVVVLVMGRGLRVSARSRRRLKKGPIRKRRSFSAMPWNEDATNRPSEQKSFHTAASQLEVYPVEGDVYLEPDGEDNLNDT